ncbi:MAG: hypothetical protein QXY80_05075 [Candidatus Jordarchaeales archaeon]
MDTNHIAMFVIIISFSAKSLKIRRSTGNSAYVKVAVECLEAIFVRLKINVECKQCGGNVTHEVELEGDVLSWFQGQLSAAGVAPLSLDHGDHVLIVYVDARGNARASYAYPVVKKKVEGGGWVDVGGVALMETNVSVLFADWAERVYCSAYWRGGVSPVDVLPHADVAKFVSVGGREFWVLAAQSSRMIVAKGVGWSRGFFQSLQEFFSQATRAEPKIVRSATVQAILVSIASNPSFYTPNSASIFTDLEKRVVLTRAAKALFAVEHGFESEFLAFLNKLQSYGTLGEAVLSSTPTQIALLAKYYRTLKNTGVIKVEEGTA